ncbi:hypothetical protein [Streptomyces sp. NPDC056069]|uniref:hypothetical protein n=1 Tax=Streptomyces sp. NPDC056069 TaxID=3345702 RepID=UPI0035E26E7D
MKKLLLTLLASTVAAGALIGGTAGTAQAAVGSKCNSWTKVHSSGLWARTCIEWDGTSWDRGYIEFSNTSGSASNVRLSIDLSEHAWGYTIGSNSKIKAVQNGETVKVYTPWIADNHYGPERAIGIVVINPNTDYYLVKDAGVVHEPLF